MTSLLTFPILAFLVLTALTVGAYLFYTYSNEQGAITFAVRKRLILYAFQVLSASVILLFLLPRENPTLSPFDAIFWVFFIPLIVIHLVYYFVEEFSESKARGRHFDRTVRFAGEATFRRLSMSITFIPLRWLLTKLQLLKPTIFYGRSYSRFDSSSRRLGNPEPDHHISVGMSGAGKSRSLLFNNLFTWSGSAIVLDPKAELCSKTAFVRNCFWGKTAIFDPYGLVGNSLKRFVVKYDPLSEVDLSSPSANAYLTAFAEGCFLEESGNDNTYWRDNSISILVGVIVHFLSRYDKEWHKINEIAKTVTQSTPEEFEELVADMSTNDAFGGAPARAANIITRAGEKQLGFFLVEIGRSLRWANDPAMMEHLEGGDGFSMNDLNLERGTTLYVVLPFDKMVPSAQSRWMRVITEIAITSRLTCEHEPKNDLLVLADEFLALGYFRTISEKFLQLRSYRVRLWLILQDMSMGEKLYDLALHSMLSNATFQLIGTNCKKSADYVSQQLGHVTEKGGPTLPLMSADRVISFLGKSSKNQIVLPSDGLPLRIRNVDIDDRRSFKPSKLLLKLLRYFTSKKQTT